MRGTGEPPLVQLLLDRSYASKREVIEAIGAALVSSSAVTPAYVDGMLRKEEQGSTQITDDVALPHGTHDVRHTVLRNALVVVPIPAGVEWTPGRYVRLAIGFAGVGDKAHLRLLAAVAHVLSDEEMLSQLKSATDAREVAGLLDGLASQATRS